MANKYTIEGKIQNGAYEKVALAIENGNLNEVETQIKEATPHKSGISSLSNLNEIKPNLDHSTRSIVDIAIKVLEDCINEPNVKTRALNTTNAFSILDLLINNSDIIKYPKTLPILNELYKRSVNGIDNKLLKKKYSEQFENKILKFKEYHLAKIREGNEESNTTRDYFENLVKTNNISSSDIDEDLANIILEIYKETTPHISWNEIRDILGKEQLTAGYITDRLKEEINDYDKNRTENLGNYILNHIEEFKGKIGIEDNDLMEVYKDKDDELFKTFAITALMDFDNIVDPGYRTSWTAFQACIDRGFALDVINCRNFVPTLSEPSTFKQLQDMGEKVTLDVYAALLKKENAISDVDLKQAIQNNLLVNPSLAILLVEYYIRNDLQKRIPQIISLEALHDLGSKNDTLSKKLFSIIQSSGAVSLNEQIESKGGLFSAKKIGLSPFIKTMTPSKLNIALSNGDLDLSKLNNEKIGKHSDMGLFSIHINKNTPEFKVYIDLIEEKFDNNQNQELLENICEAAESKPEHIKILADKGLLNIYLKHSSPINILKKGRVDLLNTLSEKELIDLHDVDVETGNTLLHYAAANGLWEIANKILEQEAYVKNSERTSQTPNKNGLTPLSIMLNQPRSSGRDETITKLFASKGFKYKNERVNNSIAHLLKPIADDDLKTAELLIKGIVQISSEEKRELRLKNVYEASIILNKPSILKLLHTQNYSKYSQPKDFLTKDGLNALELASEFNNLAAFKAVLEFKEIKLNSYTRSGLTILHKSALTGRTDIVKLLLATEDVDPNIHHSEFEHHLLPDLLDHIISLYELKRTNTAEFENVGGDNKLKSLQECFELIVSHKAVDLNAKNEYGNSPIITIFSRLSAVAKEKKNLEELRDNKTLLDKLTAKDEVGKTIAILEAQENFLENQYKFLIDQKDISIALENNEKQNLLSLTVQSGDLERFEEIIDKKLNDNKPLFEELAFKLDNKGNSVFMHAIASKNDNFLKVLKSKSISIDASEVSNINNDGQGILISAIKSGIKDNVKYALELVEDNHTQLKLRDTNGNNALHHIPAGSNIFNDLISNATIKTLIDQPNNFGQTPLLKAIIEGNSTLTESLIAAGADVNPADLDGNTPLMYACMLNRIDIINSLLAKPELDIRKTSNIGANAYMYATLKGSTDNIDKDSVQSGNPQLLKSLIERGADPFFGNYYKAPTERMLSVMRQAVGFSILNTISSKALGSDSAIYKGIRTMGALKVSKKAFDETHKAVEKSMRSLLGGDEGGKQKIDLNKTCLIGAISVGRFGIVYRGESLKKYFENHERFEKADKGIYTIEDWRTSFTKSPEDRLKVHNILQARYSSIQQTLDTRYMPFWTRISLNRMLKDITEADNEISTKFWSQTQDTERTLMTDIPLTLKMLNTKNRDRFITSILENQIDDNALENLNDLLSKIRKKEIIVPAKIMHDFVQFEKRKKEIEYQRENPSIFRKIFGINFGRQPDLKMNEGFVKEISQEKSYKDYLGKAPKISDNLASVPAAERNTATPSTPISMLSTLTGTEPDKLIDDISYYAGSAAGAASAALTFAIMDFEVASKSASIALGTLNTMGQSVALGGQVYNLVSNIDTKKLVIGGAIAGAAAVGAYAYYSYNKSASDSTKEVKFEPKSLEDTYNAKCSPEQANEFLKNELSSIKINVPSSDNIANLDKDVKMTAPEAEILLNSLPSTRIQLVHQELAESSLAAYITVNKVYINTGLSVNSRTNSIDRDDASSRSSEIG